MPPSWEQEQIEKLTAQLLAQAESLGAQRVEIVALHADIKLLREERKRSESEVQSVELLLERQTKRLEASKLQFSDATLQLLLTKADLQESTAQEACLLRRLRETQRRLAKK